jgi:hypothetical protein
MPPPANHGNISVVWLASGPLRQPRLPQRLLFSRPMAQSLSRAAWGQGIDPVLGKIGNQVLSDATLCRVPGSVCALERPRLLRTGSPHIPHPPTLCQSANSHHCQLSLTCFIDTRKRWLPGCCRTESTETSPTSSPHREDVTVRNAQANLKLQQLKWTDPCRSRSGHHGRGDRPYGHSVYSVA